LKALTAALLLGAPAALHAGAWTRAAGEFYGKAGLSRTDADKVYGPKGNKKLPGPKFKESAFSLYGEYGFTGRWTGVSQWAFKGMSSESGGVKKTESGPADAWFHLKRGLAERPLALAVQAGAKLPLGYDPDGNPPLGQGQVDLEARFLAGKSFYPRPFYLGAELGYRRRNGPFSDEIPYRLEAGAFLAKPFLLKLSADGLENRANDDAGKKSGLPAHIFDQEHRKAGPSLIYFFGNGLALEAGYDAVIAGGNTAAARTFSLGLAWQGKIY
jgi:hypothetical protein